MKHPKKRLILIDSNALLHRAYHALPPLTKKDGTLTNAVYGYALTLLGVWDRFKPDFIVATFDLAAPTFRHRQYEDYKATRKKAPDDFYQQIPLAKDLLKAFNIPIYEKAGFEADDIIGTIAKDPGIDGQVERVIVTGDLDTLQLVDKQTKVFTLRRGITDTFTYDEEAVKERYGLSPDQMVDFKGLRGDPSDNIPGVKGVGEKSATDLLMKYGSLDAVYANVENILPASLAKKLKDGKESAVLSRQLATIDTQVPINFDLESCRAQDYDRKTVLDFLQKMEFYSLVKRLKGDQPDGAVGETKGGKGGDSDRKKKSGPQSKAGKNYQRQSIFVVDSQDKIEALLKVIKKKKNLAFSCCTSGTYYYSAKMLGYGVWVDESEPAYFVPSTLADGLTEIIDDKQICKVAYNVKYEMEILGKSSPNFSLENYFDVQVAAYLLRSGTNNDLDKLVFEEFGQELSFQKSAKGQASLLAPTDESLGQGAAERAMWAGRLYAAYAPRLDKISQEQKDENQTLRHTIDWVFQEMELPLVKILAGIEMAGVKVDKTILAEVSGQAQLELAGLEKEIYQLAKTQFNINSPIQLAKVLYDDLGLPTADIKKGKTGFSTDADQLRKIRELHPIVPLIEQYRELFKVKTTYTDTLPLLVAEDGRIHALFNQAVTATGRLSSSEPNLQNIPKKGSLAKMIRQAFVAEKGYQFVAADYSQIDLRVAAHLSGDKRLIEAFKSGRDIHRATAAWVNGIQEEEVTDRQRSEAKSLNFGVLYGMGIYGFMRDSGVSRQRAEQFISQYMERFSGLKDFLDQTKKFAADHGYVETEIGRRRYIANLDSSNFQLRSAAERMAINLPVQGLSADIMKLAMLEVDKQVISQYGADARLVLQIHDELIFEVKDGLIDKFVDQVKKTMEGVYTMRVPLLVDVAKGKNWAEV